MRVASIYYIEMIVNVTVTSFDREIFDGRVSPACWGLKIVSGLYGEIIRFEC